MFELYRVSQVQQRKWTASQTENSMAGMYRVHCFKTFGGQDWMKILLALGHVDAKVTEIANDITTRRIQEKAGRDASTLTQPDPILSKRTRQIMEGVAAAHIDPHRAPKVRP